MKGQVLGLILRALAWWTFTVGPGNCPSPAPIPSSQPWPWSVPWRLVGGDGGRLAETLMRWVSSSWGSLLLVLLLDEYDQPPGCI